MGLRQVNREDGTGDDIPGEEEQMALVKQAWLDFGWEEGSSEQW